MTEDQIFRRVLAIAFGLTLLIALPARLRSRTSEKLDRRQEGAFILATLRPAGLLCWLAAVAYMINPAWMAWSNMSVPVWLRWCGVALWGIAAALVHWAFRNLGRNLTDTVVTRRDHTLVLAGPYRWVRNPFYDAAALLMLALALVTSNWFVLLTGATVFVLLVIRTRIEEQHLIARFGDDYRQYMSRTGRFLPRLKA